MLKIPLFSVRIYSASRLSAITTMPPAVVKVHTSGDTGCSSEWREKRVRRRERVLRVCRKEAGWGERLSEREGRE